MHRRVIVAAALSAFVAFGCATTPEPRQSGGEPSQTGEELSLLMSQLRHDLALVRSHDSETAAEIASIDTAGDDIVQHLTQSRGIVLPVVGVSFAKMRDNFGDPRDGGRTHRGLDIFAPRGTPVVAAMDGQITYVGVQSRGGRCLWLTSGYGRSFYYAHLDRWAEGVREGVRVRRGTVLGYVGTTGNARGTRPHLHFQVREGADDVDPWEILRHADGADGEPVLAGGFGQ